VAYVPNEGEIDTEEAAAAQRIAEEAVEEAGGLGCDASARISEATESAAKTIAEVADEIDAGLIVCGQRGLGPVRSALLGSVSHALSARAQRPVLIAPTQGAVGQPGLPAPAGAASVAGTPAGTELGCGAPSPCSRR
jgi:nucleotide-binding universal stress UspA family protein